MNYKLKDGGVINASTPAEFVTNMRKSSRFDSDCSDAQYMENFAERFKIQAGRDIRFDSAEHFLQDLLDDGFVSEE